jgi:Uma2 family endonuclease
MATNPERWMTVPDYLQLDESSSTKYEYHHGEIVAMSGGSLPHSALAERFKFALMNAVGFSGPCRVYGSDVKVKLAESYYVYPDAVVSCDVADTRSRGTILHSPHLVVEVLSPSTESKDRGEKAEQYRAHPAVKEYVLVNTKRPSVEVQRRDEQGQWTIHNYTVGDTIRLECLDIHIPMQELYEGIPLEE